MYDLSTDGDRGRGNDRRDRTPRPELSHGDPTASNQGSLYESPIRNDVALCGRNEARDVRDTARLSIEGEVLTTDHCPRVLPPGWITREFNNVFHNRHRRLTVIFSVERERDGRRWVHVSVSRTDRFLPTWEDLKHVKAWTIGADKLAIQILPPDAEFVNIHPGVLHLWHCLDGSPVPDFRHGGQI